jgi:hypothetical protein
MLIGSVGVGLLLLAFVLNLVRVLSETSRWYLGMNFVGAALACYYAWEEQIIPFAILEAVWSLTALVKLFMSSRNQKENPRPAEG